MNSKIDMKVTGIRGGSPSWNDNKGQVTLFVDKDYQTITVDAFQGRGETYQRRNKALIEITNGDEILTFNSFEDLFNTLKGGMI